MPTKAKLPLKKKEKMPTEPHWKSAVAVLLTFLAANFGESAAKLQMSMPRDLKMILRHLRENAENLNFSWDTNTACRTLFYFLEFARTINLPEITVPHDAKWFMVFCNQHKDEILEQIRIYKLQKTKPNEVQNIERN